MSRPGQNVRRMAQQRRFKATKSLLLAGMCIVIPFFIPAASIWVHLGGFALAGPKLWQARSLLIRAKQADQGAAGEEEIARLLAALKTKKWQIEYGIVDRSVGDVDVFLLSPKGKAFTIDVKSHRGTVCSDGKQLYRQYGQDRKSFEKDFLKQAKRQALTIKELKQLRFVTPIVAFSNARVNVGKEPIEGVYVVGKQELLNCLRSLGQTSTG